MNSAAWDDIEDDENAEEERFEFGGRDSVIFLIDATEPMFTKKDEEDSPFRTSLECCRTTMLNKIIGSEKDLVGIILFGTEKTNNVLNGKHITTLQELEQSCSTKIKELEEMLDSESFNDFKKKYGHSSDFSLSDALWLCQMLFSNSTLKLVSQRILLFTCNDNPHADKLDQARALDKADILHQNGIELEFCHMGKDFNPALFYQELIQRALGEDCADFVLPDPSTKLDELLTRVRRRNHKQRTVGRVLFKLGGDVAFGVSIYNLVRKTPLPKKVWLDKKSNEIVHSVVQSFDETTGDLMLPSDLAKFQYIGGKRIIFKQEEVKNVRHMMDQGLYLMGFKPADCITSQNHYTPSSFIYPDESTVKGSRQIFAALLDRCLCRSVVPICWFVPRWNSPPQLVALKPQQEKLDKHKMQVLPPGFHVVFLPYEDNIRKLELPKVESASPEQVDLMKSIINKLKFKYDPHSIDNPKLQTHWSNVETFAMGRQGKEVTDYTKPQHEEMARKLGDLATDFVDTFYPADFDPMGKAKAKPVAKRGGEATGPKPAKAPKTAKVSADIDMKDLVMQRKVEKCKVDELKEYLQSVGAKVSGKKKADLINMVYEYFDQSN